MQKLHPDLEWMVSDATKFEELSDGMGDFLFDKGTLDALRGGQDTELIEKLFVSYSRVLRRDGVAIVVSSCMEDVCRPMLQKHFMFVETTKLPKKNLEILKARVAAFNMEIREY